MKNLALIITLIFSLIVAACQQSPIVDSETTIPVNQANDNKAGNSQSAIATPSPPTIRSPVEIKSKYPLLWGTTVTSNDFKNTENPLELFS